HARGGPPADGHRDAVAGSQRPLRAAPAPGALDLSDLALRLGDRRARLRAALPADLAHLTVSNETTAAHAGKRRIQQPQSLVADVIVETPDTATLVLFTGNDRLEYSAGHFLTIDPHQFEALERFTAFLEDLKGQREPPRAYSMCSAPHERYLAVTVKEERYV